MDIKPDFQGLKALEVNAHIHELLNTTNADAKAFPLDVFPAKVVKIIKDADQALGFPVEFTAAGMLYAAAVAIGNTHVADFKRGYEQTAVLYLAIVGRPGANKSHPLSFALTPIQRKDSENQKRNREARKEFERISAMQKNERESAGIPEPEKPKDKQILLTDFTPEALVYVHSNNPRGIGVYCDELASWFLNFNRYHKGSEEQFWLSAWSGKPIQVNRRNSENLRVEMPFIPVIGTMQPAIIRKLAENRQDTGFIERILFVYPDNLTKKPWSEVELPETALPTWNNLINRLLEFELQLSDDGQPDPIFLKFAPDAKKRMFQWQEQITALSNDPERESLCATYAKMEPYAIRFSLILQLMKYAAGEAEKNLIGIEAVEGAIRLTDYFIANAKKVLTSLNDKDATEALTDTQRRVFQGLPEIFSTAEGLKIATAESMPQRNFERFIKNRTLFKQLDRGQYRKLA